MKLQSRSKKTGAVAVALALAFVGLGASPVSAETPGLSDEIRQQYVNVFNERGIDQATQDSLLAKIASGHLPDADLQTVAPVSTKTTTSGNRETTRNVYPDGSVDEMVFETETRTGSTGSGIQTRAAGISGCGSTFQTATHIGKTFCTVYYNGISWSYTFKADYGLAATSTAKAYISKAYGPEVNYVIGGSVVSKKTSVTRANAVSQSSPARARMAVELFLGVGPVGGTVTSNLYLNVWKGDAWVSYD